jgi:hypothetical protein
MDFTAAATRPQGVHLVGSIPLADNADVFRTMGYALGNRLRRLPDGETGRRLAWTAWTEPSYHETDGLEIVEPPPGIYTVRRQARLTVAPEELRIKPLGYADAALASYAVFSDLQRRGGIPQHVRFQVCLPATAAHMLILVEEDSRAGVEPAHVRQLLAELGQILDAIPQDKLAIQWDVCQEVGIWEGHFDAWFDDPREGVTARLAQLAEAVPEPVNLGFHFCYGDFRHEHFMQPHDLGVLVEMANALAQAAPRPISWIHLPVPADRDDPAFFAPLTDLDVGSTELYLGLIHLHDGEDGAARRIEAARSAVEGFGVGTECGFGRRDPETIKQLIDLHARVADPIA